MSNPAFRGHHKVNSHTPVLGHNLSKRLGPSRYEHIKKFDSTFSPTPEIVVVHYSFVQKLWLIIKYFLSCIFPKK